MIEKLNGHRVPLLINGAMFIPVISWLVFMYSDIQSLKADRMERGPVERLAKIEAQVQMGIDNRYRATDAGRDFALRDLEIQRLERDVHSLQDCMDKGR